MQQATHCANVMVKINPECPKVHVFLIINCEPKKAAKEWSCKFFCEELICKQSVQRQQKNKQHQEISILYDNDFPLASKRKRFLHPKQTKGL